MKQKLFWILLAFTTAVQGASLGTGISYPPELVPSKQEAQAAHLTAVLLSRFHYKGVVLDDALSEKVFDQYFKSLDPEKLFFVQSDIDQFAGERTKLDDAILNEDLGVPFAIYNLYAHRLTERFAYARSLLKTGFDFRTNESYQFTRDKAARPQTEAEMRELWRKRVKNDWLRLRLAGVDDGKAVEILDRRYGNFMRRVGQLKSADAFQTYMNACTMAIEPHTNYLGPRAAEDFGISMSLSLVGIGAVLAEIDEYTTIRELVPGGPASLSEQLKVGDRIVGVAQGADGTMTDVMGWRLDDTVALIRGPANTVVMLDVLPADSGPDSTHKLVSLIRKKITLEEQAARQSIHSVSDGRTTRRIGVITLPAFYEDFAGRQKGLPDYKSATRDVSRLLDQLKKEKVDGVIIDLRNNGGGSLTEAIELTGLFIDQGPVVQQRSAGGEITVGSDTQPGTAWSGPLGVLINRGSASASEIFAAAIQDYERGLIVGEPSFGKGTVQTIIDLDQVAKSDSPQFGELKLTVAQFFRVNGGTTQLRGVTPDIIFPGIADAESFGESSFENALPWTQIKATDYSPVGALKGLLPVLIKQHDARVKTDPDFRNLLEDIAEFRLQRSKNQITLNEAARRQERDAREAKMKLRETHADNGASKPQNATAAQPAPDNRSALRDDGLQSGERNLANELAAEKLRKNANDPLLNEAVRILGDEIGLLESRAGIATSAGTGMKPKPD
jgi:carboxyl-terminal processing protease